MKSEFDTAWDTLMVKHGNLDYYRSIFTLPTFNQSFQRWCHTLDEQPQSAPQSPVSNAVLVRFASHAAPSTQTSFSVPPSANTQHWVNWYEDQGFIMVPDVDNDNRYIIKFALCDLEGIVSTILKKESWRDWCRRVGVPISEESSIACFEHFTHIFHTNIISNEAAGFTNNELREAISLVNTLVQSLRDSWPEGDEWSYLKRRHLNLILEAIGPMVRAVTVFSLYLREVVLTMH
eukprot:TRINITY_DN6856_c0_g2_i1.p1 TRINITY_DN6856_c0_g2~~TRINITY_DN6856_c0_g2_i1.p1  ORF type:complete len:234 (-),score=15.05 TRINITY_DN6856_c0_g2_i1:973-1674(-)